MITLRLSRLTFGMLSLPFLTVERKFVFKFCRLEKPLRKTNPKVWVLFMASCLLFSACTDAPTPVPQPNSDRDPAVQPQPPESRTLTTWTINPNFSESDIGDPETLAWYRRAKLEIARERKQKCLPPGTAPEAYPFYPASATLSACSGVKHFIGRGLQSDVNALLTLFRVTGDHELLEEIDRLMEIAKAQLSDTDGDGYRNWYWLDIYDTDDFNLKEDTLAHSYIPVVSYVFQKNARYGTATHDYKVHADEWLDYLRKEFEAKWAIRSVTAGHEGLPVKNLFHPYIEMLRYTVYMAKLFPEDGKYQRLQRHLAATVLNEFKIDSTDNGDAFVWSHTVRQEKFGNDPDECLHFQMGSYPNQTIQTFMDLALEGYPGFADTETMRTLSRTVSESILEPNQFSSLMYKDVGGLRNGSLTPNTHKQTYIGGWCFEEAPFSPNSDPTTNFRSEASYLEFAYAFMAPFAADDLASLEETEIYKVNRHVYGDSTNKSTKLTSVSVPAAMAFARLYHSEGFNLQD